METIKFLLFDGLLFENRAPHDSQIANRYRIQVLQYQVLGEPEA
jgi:hypothetical protein